MTPEDSRQDYKYLLLDCIKVSRGLIRELNTCQRKFPGLANKCFALMATQQAEIKVLLNDLVCLERRVKRSSGETNISSRPPEKS